MNIYGLILNLTLLNGTPSPVTIEVYTDLDSCKVEAAHQVIQGVPKDKLSCELFVDTDDSLE